MEGEAKAANESVANKELTHLGTFIDDLGALEERIYTKLGNYARGVPSEDETDQQPAEDIPAYFANIRTQVWKGEAIASRIRQLLDVTEL